MSLFRIWPFRILFVLVISLLATDLALITTSGRPSAPVALHVVAASDYSISEPSISDELRDIKRASRSQPRTPLPQAHPQAVHQVVHHPRSVSKPRLVAVPQGVLAWAHSRKAIGVANCESGPGPHAPKYDAYIGDPHLRDGIYHGKWQMDPDFWRSYGGLRYASDAADASEAEQDVVAYRGFLARGWQPWECAHLV